MIKISRKKITGEDVEKKGILASYLGHWELVTHTMRTLWSFLKKSENRAMYDPDILPLGV